MATDEELQLADEDAQGVPDLPVLLEEVIQATLERMHACAPAVVQAVDAVAGTVSAQPTVTKTGEGDEPVIPSVPMLQLRTALAEVTLPGAAGAPVLLLYSDRSLDEWAASSGARPAAAKDPRAHDPSDALAVPLAPGGADAANVVIRCLSAAGLVLLGGDVATATHAVLLGDLVQSTMAAFFSSCAGALDPAVVTAATTASGTLAAWLSTRVKVA